MSQKRMSQQQWVKNWMKTASKPCQAHRRATTLAWLLAIGCSTGLVACNNFGPTAVKPSPSPSLAPLPSASPAFPSPSPSVAATPEKPEFTKTLETKLRTVVGEATRASVESINCPAKATVAVGDRFDCQATAAGQTFAVAVQITDATGQFKWNTRGLLLLSKLEAFIQTRVKEKGGGEVKTDCGGKLRTVKPGDAFECKVTDAQGRSRVTKVTVKDEQGNVDIALL